MADELKIVASLDIPKSVQEINKDIPKLQGQSKHLKIIADLDPKLSIKNIQATLNKMNNNANIKVGIDTIGFNSVQGATQNITNSLKNVQTQAQQTAKSIHEISTQAQNFKFPVVEMRDKEGNTITDTVKTLQNARDMFGKLGFTNVKFTWADEAGGVFDRLTAKVTDSYGAVQNFKFALLQGSNNYTYDGAFGTDSGVEKLSTQIEETRVKYNRLLSDFKSSNSAIQSGLTQPIEQFEAVLNGLGKTSSVNDVKNAFESLKQSASDITQYLDTTNSSFNKATNAINNFKNMDNILKEMTVSFDKLSNKPTALKTELDSIKKKLLELQNIEKSEGTTENWAKKYREVNLELAQLKTNIKLAGQASKGDDKAQNDLRIEYVNKLNNAYKQLISYKNKLASATNSDSQTAYTEEIRKTEIVIDNLTKQLYSGELITYEIQKQIDLLNEQVVLTDRINRNKVSDARKKQTTQAFEQQAKQLKNYETQIDKTIKKLNDLNNSTVFKNNASNPQVSAEKNKISNLITEYQNLKSQLNENITSAGLENIGNQLNKLDERFTSVTTSANSFKQSLKDDNSAEKLRQKISVLTTQIKEYQKINTKSLKQFGNDFTRMLNDLNDPNLDAQGLEKIKTEFQNIKREINAAGKAGKNFFGKLKEQAAKFSSWMTLTGVITSAWHQVKKMVTNVIELDSAMTNLKKVTNETETTYSRFLKNTSQQAKKLHATMTDLVEQTATWAKLGFSLQEAESLAEISMIYSKVGEVDNTTSVSDLVTAMKAFNIESSKSITIVDALNELGNNFATDAASLGEGLTKSASALSAANNSFEQSVALLTGGTEITQNANEMGSALKVISMRIRGMKGELQALGEEYEDIESISKIQTQILNLTNGKVNIFDNNGNFRSTYDILKDISEIYDSLSDPDKADLTEILFGKMRGNQGIALIQAFQSGQIEKAYEAAKNSAGSAQKEFDRWSQSIESHLNTLSASFQSLSQTVVNSDPIKFIVDRGTDILNILDGIITTIGEIPSLLLTISGIALFKNVGSPKMFGLVLICQQ